MGIISRRRFVPMLAQTASMALILLALAAPSFAWADEAESNVDQPAQTGPTQPMNEPSDVDISAEGTSAKLTDAAFALDGFTRAQKGSNRDIAGEYHGYAYLTGQETDTLVQAVAGQDFVVVHIPAEPAEKLGIDPADPIFQIQLKQVLIALDEEQAVGSVPLSSLTDWRFTTEDSYDVGGVRFLFNQQIDSNVYVLVRGVDGSDTTDDNAPEYFKPAFADYAKLASPETVVINKVPEGLAAIEQFLFELDWSPLWITLKTTLTATAIIFVLGLISAYFCLGLSPRARNIADSLFTIPMVLPPTVCGFVLLYLCGSNTAFGQFFIDVGFPLIFSWPATVIAAVVVAFPLMYRSALGAFEGLDPDMLDAARTLGWSNARVFLRLMLPLSWSSIAAGTVLAFARALGEFGATLFLAGNYLGITRTIPIAIYFEWMNGNDGVAWFWTAIVIGFSFLVILFINLWSSRTTRYRKGIDA